MRSRVSTWLSFSILHGRSESPLAQPKSLFSIPEREGARVEIPLAISGLRLIDFSYRIQTDIPGWGINQNVRRAKSTGTGHFSGCTGRFLPYCLYGNCAYCEWLAAGGRKSVCRLKQRIGSICHKAQERISSSGTFVAGVAQESPQKRIWNFRGERVQRRQASLHSHLYIN